MLKKLFGKKDTSPKSVEIYAPVSGKVLRIEEVPDPVFSQKMMGDGVAFEPSEGKVVSPVDGEVLQVFPTKHAIGLKAENGAEILLHIGLETVAMDGEGFNVYVSEGSKVKKGDVLITFDLNLVKEKASSTITPLVITNSDGYAANNHGNVTTVTAGEEVVLTIEVK